MSTIISKTVGIIGDGQLAQLMAHSAYQLGVNTLCFSKNDDCPAARVSPIFMGDLKDFEKQVDVVTIENENIDINTLENITHLSPNIKSIAISQDRLLEKKYFQECDIPTTIFFEINTADDLLLLKTRDKSRLYNGILKTRRFGYDGKGQLRITEKTNLNSAFETLNAPAIVEMFVEFDTEISLLLARNKNGQTVYFPLIENMHENGILRTSHFFSHEKIESIARQAHDYGKRLADSLDYVGVLAIEFFLKNNQLIANEMAPRVHNSGHLTIEGCNVSQFELHCRAILDLPLIQPIITHHVEMINIIGEWPKQINNAIHIYNYGKTPRENRKLGHYILSKKSDKLFRC